MALAGRYDAAGVEAEFEPGSRRRVLRNLLGIRSVRDMQKAESRALYLATQVLIDETLLNQRFMAADLSRIHRLWLGGIYPWAGEYRSVNIAKGGFMFAAADQVSRLMGQLEDGPLRELTPCRADTAEAQARALGIVHAELVLIHPFRDGNGRCARVLSTLMGLQAGLPPLDFSAMDGRGKRQYIEAIHAALARDYAPITKVFSAVVERTLRASGTSA